MSALPSPILGPLLYHWLPTCLPSYRMLPYMLHACIRPYRCDIHRIRILYALAVCRTEETVGAKCRKCCASSVRGGRCGPFGQRGGSDGPQVPRPWLPAPRRVAETAVVAEQRTTLIIFTSERSLSTKSIQQKLQLLRLLLPLLLLLLMVLLHYQHTPRVRSSLQHAGQQTL